ncbi:META domain-containing protein [Trinickia dinghuensis]|uniref:META domain-containing protein n=1 Tax=Trinickia dinghuensis TaxID=2291023 RepID=A0A3D8JUR8_9BURK|nr:META domain-containing protein [Trinickia dinghuensis]RDU96475.1 META domain-containing protein [Trinickia dinghuensis]
MPISFIAPTRGASRKRSLSRVGALAAVLAVAGCAMPTHPDSAAGPSNPLNPAAVQLLDGTSWVLRSAQTSDGKSAFALPPAETAAPTLKLDTASGQRRASGFAGCNQFSGSYMLHSGGLTLGPLATTGKTCGQDAEHLEHAYLDVLSHIESTLVQMRPPQQMRIIASNGITLTFAREDR